MKPKKDPPTTNKNPGTNVASSRAVPATKGS